MSRRHKLTAFTLVVAAMTAGSTAGGLGVVAAAVDPHSYFNALVARADLFKGYSLRPVTGQPITSPYYAGQLLQKRLGGYAACNSCPLWITYDPANDRDPNAQDAAKVVIPAYKDTDLTLSVRIGESDTVLSIPNVTNSYAAGRISIRIDDEIVMPVDPDGAGPLPSVDSINGIVYVQRGAYGTKPVAHAAGAAIGRSSNTVPNAVKLPLKTTDGHTYLFTWDAYWTDSYINSGLNNHKAFNLLSDGIWLEPGARYKSPLSEFNPLTDVASLNLRSYPALGPGMTDKEPVAPQLAEFIIKRKVWTRYWIQIEQRAGDWDYMDMWMADENRAPVKVYSRIALSVRAAATSESIDEFYVEFNTSTDSFTRGDFRDLVSYVRNVVALRDAGDPTPLLQRPLAGDPLPRTGLAPPQNVRIVR